MKNLISVLLWLPLSLSAQAQGTVNFVNRITGSLDQPIIFECGPIGGSSFLAGLYEGNSLIGAPVPFRTGTGAGYWNPAPDATRVTITLPGGTATLTVKAWDASGGAQTYFEALAAGRCTGSSFQFTVVTGGAGSPPGLPGDMLNFKSFSPAGVCPEPSAIILGLIGTTVLSFWRKRPASGGV